MKRLISLSAAVILATVMPLLYAQDKTAGGHETVYTDASEFPVYGKAFRQSASDTSRYQRLPQSYEKISRKPVWGLGLNSAGLYIRFKSNSTSIHARWESTFGNAMNHMTDTGIRGLDLYTLENGKWQFVRSARPEKGKKSDVLIIGNMKPAMREYMLYLSLYDGVMTMEIGTDKGSLIEKPSAASPSTERPVVMYGTSILQGGCASRPGMAFTNILGRRLDREVINLGFSGNALLDYEIADLMASVKDPGVYVLDYVPNASASQISERGEKFFRIIRDAHPGVPVIFLEDPIFPFSHFDTSIAEEISKKNAAQEALFKKLKDSGEKNIYFLGSAKEIGNDEEATVDGIHFTDLGMMRYTDFILPVLRKALKSSKR
jgi:lysophospholipase L1-like esterase